MNYAPRGAGSGSTGLRLSSVATLVFTGAALMLSGCGIVGFGDDDPPPVTSVRRSPPTTTVVQTHTPTRPDPAAVPIASPPAEVVTTEPPPTTQPRRPPPPGRPVPVPPPTDPTNPSVEDRFGFNGDRYLSLVTPEEMDVLRLRARGDAASHLSRFLTDKERENLRRRAAELTEIGAEPLRVGE